jgi:hypothetical protein
LQNDVLQQLAHSGTGTLQEEQLPDAIKASQSALETHPFDMVILSILPFEPW